MGDGYNFKQLQSQIFKLSKAKEWETARKEWRLTWIEESEEPETCLCGHYPIVEICRLKNIITGNEADVGNRCVKRFMGINSTIVFASIKRIRNDITKSISADAAVLFFERDIISEWEYDFIQNTHRKRIFTPAQMHKRREINKKILQSIRRRGTI